MRNASFKLLLASSSLVVLTLGGCPTTTGGSGLIGGPTEPAGRVTGESTVSVAAPTSDLNIAGGTPVEVTYRVTAQSTSATVEIFFDLDQDPESGNEIFALVNVPITDSSGLLNTSTLDAGRYLIGVRLREQGQIVASDYADGQIIVNQAPRFQFLSPRSNFVFDRSLRINPTFDVAWTVNDPDSAFVVQILLDRDTTITGDEIILRESESQTGDSFSFQLRTDVLTAGDYNIVALVDDGTSVTRFIAPGTITLRGRLSGFVDLRELNDPAGGRVAGAIFEGFNPRDNAGSFLRSIDDIDADGFDDFIIVAQYGKPRFQFDTQRNGVGEAYLIYGRGARFSGRINLNSTGVLFRGDIITGIPQVPVPIRPSRGITSMDLMDDYDFDGVREIGFGVPFTDSLPSAFLEAPGYFRTGGAILLAGSALRPDQGFPGSQVIELGEVGTLGHQFINGVCGLECPEGFYGPKAIVPDIHPVFVDQECLDNAVPVATYYHGHLDPTLTAATAGRVRLGARYSSNVPFDQFAERITRYDFRAMVFAAPNRDPFDATLINNGFRNIEGAGVISVYFPGPGHTPFNTVNAPGANAAFNYPGSGGIDDRLIPHGGPYHYIVDDFNGYPLPGSITVDPNGVANVAFRIGSPGYVVDPEDGTPCTQLVSANTVTPGNTLRIWSSAPGSNLSNVDTINDFNADGIQDLAIGAPFIEDARGATFIVFGRLPALVTSAELELQELSLSMQTGDPLTERIFDGVRVVGGVNERLGQTQVSAGDFNGDGIGDVLIGSPNARDKAGAVAVFFGSRDVINLTRRDIAFSDLGDPTLGLGVVFTGESIGDQAGLRIASAGDMDRDGFDDILIAAPDRSVALDIDADGEIEVDRTRCGVVYLVYGGANLRGTIELAKVGTPELPGAIFVGPQSGAALGAGIGDGGERSIGLAAAGDVDGDGFRDLILSSIFGNPRDRVDAGETYLVYGTGEGQ
jgi:hypothetical protein